MTEKRRKQGVRSPEKLMTANPMKTLVREYFGPYPQKVTGTRFGLEIECESTNDRFPSAEGSSFWTAVNDGSLRKADGSKAGGKEYISTQPFTFEECPKALKELDGFLSKARTKLKPTIRTSVHVHLNTQHLTLSQLMCLFTVYYSVEPLLCRFNGYEREHNLHAVQAIHSPHLIYSLIEFAQSGRLDHGGLKYSALNWAPLYRRFGTIEFRAGRGIQKSALDCLPWIELVNEVQAMAARFDNPTDILLDLSSFGSVAFVKERLPKVYKACKNLYEDEAEFENTIMEAVRTAQPLCYDIDWSEYEPEAKIPGKKSVKGPRRAYRTRTMRPTQGRQG
jgi:hypothetical protein